MRLGFVCFFVFTIGLSYSFGQSNIDVLHYKFEIELSDKSDTLKGRAFVTLQFTQASNKFPLSLVSPDGKGKGMVAYKVRERDQEVSSTHSSDSLIIYLKKPAQKNETRTFEILYQGIPVDGLIISENKYGDRTFFGDNWPNRARNWLPCKDEPGDKATFEFLVTAPSQYRVISNGRLQEEKMLSGDKKFTHWIEDVSLSTKVMVIGVAKFAIKLYEDSPPNIPISAWVYPQDSVTGFRNYSPAPAIVKFLSEYIGPYPYNKLANVQSTTIFGGMENASAIFYDEESAGENKPIEGLLAHEIAHQWFGDMATEKSFAHLWLSEGFATYMATLYMEYKYGPGRARTILIGDRDTVIDYARFSDLPVVDEKTTDYMSLLNVNSYQKGGWVLHMLRRQLGDSIFWKGIRNYYSIYAGKNADTHDLQVVFEKASGKNLSTFFKQWLYSPGIPKLDVGWAYLAKEKKILVTVKQLQENAFAFPLELQLQSETGNNQRVVIKISKPEETFFVPAKEKISSVILDPNISLLFEGRISLK